MIDRIAITGIEGWAHHGVLAHEREDGQAFAVDVVMEVDLRQAATSDDLADTVDYGTIAGLVHATLTEGTRRDLIEAVAADIAGAVLGHDARVDAVEVTVHKPSAPVPVRASDITVTIRRTRAGT